MTKTIIRRWWAGPAAALIAVAALGWFVIPANGADTTYAVSAACGHHYKPNSVWVDGDVDKPVSLTAGGLQSLPGQETLNISYLNHLGTLQQFSETGPTLWNVLAIAAGGVKVPPPTPNQYAGPSPQTALYILVIGTDGYQTVVAEGDIDPGFSNAPILVAYAENGIPLSQVPYSATENKGPAQLVVPNDTHGGRYANQICRITVVDGAL
jgi:hypothetical protein